MVTFGPTGSWNGRLGCILLWVMCRCTEAHFRCRNEGHGGIIEEQDSQAEEQDEIATMMEDL